jgi:hypothetical protein
MCGFMRWIFLVCVAVFAAPANAVVFTVGADALCTHSSVFLATLAAGANGAGMDEIRVATNMNHDGVLAPVVSQNLHVRGGYSDCTDTTPSGRTPLTGTTSGANGTFTTSGTASGYTLILEDLDLWNAGNSTRRGGAVRIEGSFTVELRSVVVSGNSAGRGGGIYLDGSDGAGLVLTENTVIEENAAAIGGGGIYCQDGGIILMVASSISENSAADGGGDPNESGNGGGVALYGCNVVQSGVFGTLGVSGNTAARHGGGYYLRNGAQLTLDGSATAPARIESNQAVETGGGVAVNDTLPAPVGGISTAFIRNSWVDSNRARSGSGLGLIAGGNITMQRTLAPGACHNGTYCSSLSFNDKTAAATSCVGAAVFAGEASQLRLQNTYIEENCVSDGGWAFRQRLDSQIRIDSSVIARNGGSSPFFIDGSGVTVNAIPGFTGRLELGWSTVAGHYENIQSAMFYLPSGSPSSTGTLRVYGSLLAERFLQMTDVGGPGSPPPMTLEFDCLLLDSVFAGNAGAIRSFESAAPYGMTNPAANDYRPGSPMAAPVDSCDNSLAVRANGDADLQTGIVDTPKINAFGARDIGAYELVVVAVDAVFGNGFE